MKNRPFKITMNFNGQVPDKIWFKRFKKAISKGNFEVVSDKPTNQDCINAITKQLNDNGFSLLPNLL